MLASEFLARPFRIARRQKTRRIVFRSQARFNRIDNHEIKVIRARGAGSRTHPEQFEETEEFLKILFREKRSRGDVDRFSSYLRIVIQGRLYSRLILGEHRSTELLDR